MMHPSHSPQGRPAVLTVVVALSALGHAASFSHALGSRQRRGRARLVRPAVAVAAGQQEEYDVVVIGSGIGGLSAAAAVASTGLTVAVVESHSIPGGAAHEFDIKGFKFESGPSLYAGLSPDASPNPLKHVFQIIGEEPEWITYDRWGTYLPEGSLCYDGVGA